MGNSDFLKNLLTKYGFYILGAACLVAVGVIYLTSARTSGVADASVVFITAEPRTTEEPEVITEPQLQAEPRQIMVHVVGAVLMPGVYVLEEGARINDALQMAGPTAEADISRLNLAAVAVDAMQIIVPKIGEDIDELLVYDEPGGGDYTSGSTGLVDINRAGSTELQTLPGIGPALADAIISFREANGSFTSVDELMNVPRIGPATLERLRPLVVAR